MARGRLKKRLSPALSRLTPPTTAGCGITLIPSHDTSRTTKNQKTLLKPGDTFPSLSLPLARNSEVKLPGDLAGSWAYIVFYRGHW